MVQIVVYRRMTLIQDNYYISICIHTIYVCGYKLEGVYSNNPVLLKLINKIVFQHEGVYSYNDQTRFDIKIH